MTDKEIKSAIGSNVGDELQVLDSSVLPIRFTISVPGDWEIGLKKNVEGKPQVYLKRIR